MIGVSILALARALYPVCAWTHGVGAAPGVPVNTAAPTIPSAPQVGVTVTAGTGTWTNSPTSFTYQWYNEGAPVTGATAGTYTFANADIGCLMQVQVVAINSHGSSAPAISSRYGPTIGATVRYVSSSTGDDTWTGTAPAFVSGTIGPWKTLTHVNAQSLTAGTSVLFKRGDTWRNDGCPTSSGCQLSTSSSGAAGNPIVFDAYGIGAAPAFDGSLDLSSPAAWTLISGNVWQSVHTFNQLNSGAGNGKPNNRADDPGNLIWGISPIGGTNVPSALVNANYGVMSGTGVGNIWWASGQAGLTTTGQWNFNTTTNKIQVVCATNPATGLPGVIGDLRAAIDTCLIYFNNNSNLIFQNLTLQYCAATAVDTGGAGGSCNNIIMRDMVIQWIGGGNISGQSSTDSRYGDGIDIEGSTQGWLGERIWFHQVYDTGPGPQCGGGPHQDNITFRNCVCTLCGADFSTFFLGGIPTASGLALYNNTIYCTQSCWSNNPSQRPNLGGIENVFALTVGTVHWDPVHSILTVQSNMYIANNIFAGIGGVNPDPGFGIIATDWFATGSPANPSNPFTASGPGGTGEWLDYNCWPVNIQTGGAQQIALHTGNFSMVNWVKGTNIGGAGTFTPALETHGIFSQDPIFVSQSGLNFALATGSPCLGAGVNLYAPTTVPVPSGAPGGVVWDFNKNPRPPSGAFAMGAFEPAPTSSFLVTPSGFALLTPSGNTLNVP
jgi:hypothetical protein